MKKIIYSLTILSIVLWSCGGGGGGGDTPPTPTPTNHAPTTPTLSYPTNNLLCIENPVICKWNASTDVDQGAVITYLVEVAKNSAFTDGKQTFTGTTIEQSVPLEENIAYYWRVKATDNENASSSYSTVYKFFTYGEGITNHIPFAPELVAPGLNAIVAGAPTTTNLQWTASDVDNDTLTYDVYFGTTNPTALVTTDLNTTSFEVNLVASTDYYWKVVVKDGQGGQTIGQVWTFKTD